MVRYQNIFVVDDVHDAEIWKKIYFKMKFIYENNLFVLLIVVHMKFMIYMLLSSMRAEIERRNVEIDKVSLNLMSLMTTMMM